MITETLTPEKGAQPFAITENGRRRDGVNLTDAAADLLAG